MGGGMQSLVPRPQLAGVMAGLGAVQGGQVLGWAPWESPRDC